MNKIIKYLIVLLVLSSCSISTKDMWSHKERYHDKIHDFLVSDKENQIVFLGNKYHYIIDDDSKDIKKTVKME